jgi:hypothetical protein
MIRVLMIGACALLCGCTIDGQPMIQPVTAQDPAAVVHESPVAEAAAQGPMSF